MTKLMQAVGLTRYLPIDNPESFLDVQLPFPVISGRDILVKIEAVSVNPVDTKVRSPKDKQEEVPRVLGYDASGVVEAVGEAVTLFQPGDRVFYAGDITRSGTNCQYQLVDERIVGPMPKSLSFAEAAALPLTAITAWEALFDRLRIDPDGKDHGRSVLIIGGAGGVGSIAIQLARLAGLNVIATASRPDSEAWVREMGAAYVVDHHGDLPAQLGTLGLPNVDFILCLNATDKHWAAMTQLIAPQGLICAIVDSPVPLDMVPLKAKSAGLVWEFMFTRSTYQTADMIAQHHLLARLSELVDAGKIRCTMTETLKPINAHNLRLAHAKLESGATIGKLVIEGW